MTLIHTVMDDYGWIHELYRYTPDPRRPGHELIDGEHVDDLPDLDLTSTARRLLGAIRYSGLPWDVTLSEAFSGGQVVDLRVHHLTGRWSITRWGWHRRRLVYRPHMSPVKAHLWLPDAIIADRREYQCPACQTWSRWTLGCSRAEGAGIDAFTCPACEKSWRTERRKYRDPVQMSLA